MTKIANKVAYTIKSQIVGTDYFPITNSQSNIDGMALGDTKSATFDNVKAFILAGFNPETGGQLKITEFNVNEDVPDVIADVVNAFSPPYVVAPYEMVWVKIQSHPYLLKITNTTIGVGQTPLSNGDFVEFPISAGKGIVSVEKTGTSGLVDTYTITYTDATTSTFTVTNGNDGADGADGADGTNGTNGTNGLNSNVTRTSTSSATLGNSGSKTLTYTSSSNLGWINGTRLRFFHDSANYMEGIITSISSTSVTITADYAVGSGTYSSWNISIAGDLGSATSTSGVIVSEVSSGTHANTSPHAVGISYALNFLQEGKKTLASGTITNNTGSSITATILVDITNTLYYAKAGLDTVIYAVSIASGNQIPISFNNGYIYLAGTLANAESISINGFYFAN